MTMIRRISALARKVASIVEECNYAQHRAIVLRATPDQYVIGKGKAPADYAEFLFRTSGALLHEPADRQRASGQLIG
jgi:hypothetical protein